MRFNTFVIALLAVIVCISGFAQAAEQPLPKLTLISNVNIFDGKTEKLHENMHVPVKDNLIEKVSNEPLAIIQTDNVTMIDGGGRTLMPGMIDVHWHTYYANVPVSTLSTGDMSEIAIKGLLGNKEVLMRGFTTVRDIGGNPFAVEKAIDAGTFPGPRMLVSGPPLSQTGGHFDLFSYTDAPRNPGGGQH